MLKSKPAFSCGLNLSSAFFALVISIINLSMCFLLLSIMFKLIGISRLFISLQLRLDILDNLILC
jgi:hypothetical protein